jgi:hypothetical protein
LSPGKRCGPREKEEEEEEVVEEQEEPHVFLGVVRGGEGWRWRRGGEWRREWTRSREGLREERAESYKCYEPGNQNTSVESVQRGHPAAHSSVERNLRRSFVAGFADPNLPDLYPLFLLTHPLRTNSWGP